MDSVFILK